MGKILVVDDDAATLEVIEIVFAQEGYDVLALSHCNDIEDVLKSFCPDIILMDVILGMVDGRDICRQLKSSSNRHIPLVLMSVVNGFYEDPAKPLFSDDFIEKPFNIDELTHKVKVLLPN